MLRQAQHDDTRNSIDWRFLEKRKPKNLRTLEPSSHVSRETFWLVVCS